MAVIAAPLTAYRRANQWLWRHGLWRILFVPIVLSVVLLLLALLSAFLGATWVSGQIETIPFVDWELNAYTRGILWTLIFGLMMALFIVSFRGLVMVAYGPFLDRALDRISEIQPDFVTPHSDIPTSFWHSLKRPLLIFLSTAPLALFLLVGGLLLGLVPVLGAVLSLLVIVPLQILIGAFAFVDPYYDRSGLTLKQSVTRFCGAWRESLVFGVIGLLISLIPLIGWFLSPTYSALAGFALAETHATDA